MSTKIAVIGAGPAGLTAALMLTRKGYAVEIFEAESRVGGMAQTISLWGQRVDLGPHRFFSNDPRVNALWFELLENNYSMVNRLTRIYYRETFFDYPLKAFSALRKLGTVEATRCIASYFRARLFPAKSESNFQDWVSNRFGKRLFSIFFKSYSEKLWGIPCTELDADFAVQRIKKLSLYEAIKSAFSGASAARHKTLADIFAYPREGAGAVYEAMAREITAHNGTINLATPVISVCPPQAPDRPATLRLADNSLHTFDHIISTMPITRLVEHVGAPQDILDHAGALQFRNSILVYLLVDASSPFMDQWIYVHASNLRTGRITNFSNWVPSIRRNQSETILCLEYWCYDTDTIWNTADEEIIQMAIEEAHASTLVRGESIKGGTVRRIPMSYPVYRNGYREHLKPVEKYLSSCSAWLTPIGRYGAFKYNNQDHSILMGLLAAENIADCARHDLWSINTDYEYQEAGQAAAGGAPRQ